jgi:ERI1 exoribonuclease 3
VTCGDWDLRTCLRSEAKKKKIDLPKYLRSYINLKDVFRSFFNYQGAFGMVQMLNHLGLNLEGKHHSGIDDCRNIGRIVVEMMKKGCKFGKEFVKNI